MPQSQATPKKSLRIAVVAPIEERIPPHKYGGIELVVSHITEELIHRGHTVALLASGDSKTKAKRVPLAQYSLRSPRHFVESGRERDIYKMFAVARAVEYLQSHEVDIVHNHSGWRFLAFSPLIQAPIVSTLHGSLEAPEEHMIYTSFKEVNFVSISNAQRVPLPSLPYIQTVYNGIDVQAYRFSKKTGDYLLWLGRMSKEKGPIEAIRAARAAGDRLIMAGKVDRVDREYFAQSVKPLVDGKQIQFVGEVSHKEKVKLFAGAKAMLFLIQWREPFGLVMIESLACGTPVIATNRGSVSEVIVHGEHGFIVNTWQEAAEAISRIPAISRSACRKRVEEHFTLKHMVDGYEQVYEKVCALKSRS